MTSFRTARVAPEKAVFRPALPMRSMPGLYGADMPKMTYAEQLKHPNWQRRRLEMLSRSNFKCERCQAAERTLHVHHRHYVKGRMVWEYANDELVVLCETCHSEVHDERAEFDVIVGLIAEEPGTVREVAAIVSGFAGLDDAGLDPVLYEAGRCVRYLRDLGMTAGELMHLGDIFVDCQQDAKAAIANLLQAARPDR